MRYDEKDHDRDLTEGIRLGFPYTRNEAILARKLDALLLHVQALTRVVKELDPGWNGQ